MTETVINVLLAFDLGLAISIMVASIIGLIIWIRGAE